MSLTKKEYHKITDYMQVVLAAIELNDISLAKDTIRKLNALLLALVVQQV